jgi:thiol-disulfide isomerase/thioredoxin
MPRTPSLMVPIGTPCPDFDLPDPAGIRHRRETCRRLNGLLVMFLCNHCPFVHHVAEEIARIAADAESRGIGVVGIMSNDFTSHPDDAPDRMTEAATTWEWRFPYLVDEDQSAATAFRATCTPDFFLHDGAGRLVYRGQLDGSRPGNGIPVTGEDLRDAMAAVAEGRAPMEPQQPSLGCNIKWRPDRVPSHAGA